jgi:hypothetical protein
MCPDENGRPIMPYPENLSHELSGNEALRSTSFIRSLGPGMVNLELKKIFIYTKVMQTLAFRIQV